MEKNNAYFVRFNENQGVFLKEVMGKYNVKAQTIIRMALERLMDDYYKREEKNTNGFK